MPNHQANSPGDVARRLRRLAAARRAQQQARRRQGGAPLPSPLEAPGGVESAPDVRTTVDATIRPTGSGRFRLLDWAPGEPHVVHPASGIEPAPDRARRRRSLLYFAQHTDTHLCDSQAPARLEDRKSVV